MTSEASLRDKAVGDGPQTVVTIVDMLDDLGAGRDAVSFGEMVDTLGARGFGPLLFGLALLLVLPIGMI
ncbi:exopolysaccharide biosynthesis protein, partial [Cribrihabitans sp. XS_ASV171]